MVREDGRRFLDSVRQAVRARPISVARRACSSAGAPPWPQRLRAWAPSSSGLWCSGGGTASREYICLRAQSPRQHRHHYLQAVSCACGGDPERFQRLVPACRPLHTAHTASQPRHPTSSTPHTALARRSRSTRRLLLALSHFPLPLASCRHRQRRRSSRIYCRTYPATPRCLALLRTPPF